VVGRAHGATVGDVYSVLVLTEDDLVAWQGNGGGNPILQTGQVVDVPVDVALPAPGNYAVVTSNIQGTQPKATVTVAAQLRCTLDWPPATRDRAT
jgi:hypothetical protein